MKYIFQILWILSISWLVMLLLGSAHDIQGVVPALGYLVTVKLACVWYLLGLILPSSGQQAVYVVPQEQVVVNNAHLGQ